MRFGDRARNRHAGPLTVTSRDERDLVPDPGAEHDAVFRLVIVLGIEAIFDFPFKDIADFHEGGSAARPQLLERS